MDKSTGSENQNQNPDSLRAANHIQSLIETRAALKIEIQVELLRRDYSEIAAVLRGV